MVASGTRNARAISAVVSPPTARSVSATCDGRVSAGMAAQQQQRRASRPPPGAGSAARRLGRDARPPARRRAASLRQISISRRDGHRDQPAPRVGRQPPTGHCGAAASSASCTASSAARRSRRAGARARRGPAAPARAAGPRPGRSFAGRRVVHDRPHLDRGRTALDLRDLGGDLDRALPARARRPGRSRPACSLASANGPSVVTKPESVSRTTVLVLSSASASAATNSPASASARVEHLVGLQPGRLDLLGHRGELLPGAAVLVDEDQVLHGVLPVVDPPPLGGFTGRSKPIRWFSTGGDCAALRRRLRCGPAGRPA